MTCSVYNLPQPSVPGPAEENEGQFEDTEEFILILEKSRPFTMPRKQGKVHHSIPGRMLNLLLSLSDRFYV